MKMQNAYTVSPRVTTVSTYAVSRLRTHSIKILMILQYCNIEALKLDHCDQEIQRFVPIGFRHLHRK